MLSHSAPLTACPRRILVAGVSGTGKTTLAKRIATITGAPHTEIDALFHGPAWTPRPEFEADVEDMMRQAAWVTEWQYAPVRERLAASADLLVWLDLPFWTVTFPRVVRRTVRRRLKRERLWNENIEGPLWTFFTDRDHIVRWSITTRHNFRSRVPIAERVHPNLTVVRLRTVAEVETWLSGPLTRACRR
jgi:adenylate kinase family enzyme